jgi:hypothetical protein
MTTTELIELLKKIEYGASGRPRVISLYVDEQFISEPNIKLSGTGDGVAGAEVILKIESGG